MPSHLPYPAETYTLFIYITISQYAMSEIHPEQSSTANLETSQRRIQLEEAAAHLMQELEDTGLELSSIHNGEVTMAGHEISVLEWLIDQFNDPLHTPRISLDCSKDGIYTTYTLSFTDGKFTLSKKEAASADAVAAH